ncbi:hypothetical protein ACHAWT_011046 [Skeletonema menzelii]
MTKKKRKSGGKLVKNPVSDNVKNASKKRKKSEQPSEQPSLAQLLKKYRGVAADTPAPPIWKDKLGRAYLTPDDDQSAFDECLKTSFKGFYFDTPSSLPQSLHHTFDECFEGLERGGLFLYDVVQPGKKKLTQTSVTRTLVGDPGSTYKYLGLRLFSHPWIDVDADGNALHLDKSTQVGSSVKRLGYSSRTASALIAMGRINKDLTDRSTQKLRQHVSAKPVGSTDFNLTLVNKMESMSAKRDLKKEAAYNMGKTSVGWHRDSGLKDFSSIAVYQKQKSQGSNSSKPFGVALRAMDGGAGGPLPSVPALMASLPSGSLYYMLDDFNHNHEHAVIAGDDGVRYSSTHRVAREGQGTWQYIRDKIKNLQSTATIFDWSAGKVDDPSLSPKKRKQKLVSRLRMQEALLSEIEFEWLRQWFVQGQKHAKLHPYWHDPIKFLIKSFCELEQTTVQIIRLLEKASGRGVTDSDSEDLCETLFDVLIESFSERNNKRQEWARRYKDPIFLDLAENERPYTCSCLDRVDEKECGDFMPSDLESSIKSLRELRSAFVSEDGQDETRDDAKDDKSKLKKDKKKKKKKSTLTSKEKKKVASNWNALKSKIG